MRYLRLSVSLFFILFLSSAGLTDTAPWSQVKARMLGDSGYSLRCEYAGPEGTFYFRYVVHGSGQILTEVLEGSSRGAGTRIYYDPVIDRDNVTMQTPFLRLRRSLESRDIKDSPLHKPLFAHLLDGMVTQEPREAVEQGEETVFLFGDRGAGHEFLTVDREGNPLNLRRMEAGKEVNRLTFRGLEWGEKPIEWDV